jgi:hypothetical protein
MKSAHEKPVSVGNELQQVFNNFQNFDEKSKLRIKSKEEMAQK